MIWGGGNFLRYTRCIQHSVLNMVYTFMGRWRAGWEGGGRGGEWED